MYKSILSKSSIGYKLLLSVLLVSSCITGILTIFNISMDYDNEISKIEKSFLYIEKSALPPISRALWNYDKDQVSQHIDGLLSTNFIKSIKIYTPDNKSFADTSAEQINKDYIESKTYPLIISLKGKPKVVGTMSIEYTKKYIYEELINKLIIYFLSQGLKTLMVSFFIVLIFYNLIGKSLLSIISDLEDMDVKNPKKLDNNIWSSQNDTEISGLGETINQFISKIQETNLLNYEKLQKSEELLNAAQSLSKIGSWQFSLENRKLKWTNQMYSIFPNDLKDGVPDFDGHRSTIHQDDVKHWEETVNQCLATEQGYKMRFRTVHPDKIIWVEAYGEVIKNENGRAISLIGTCQDITEKIITEDKLLEQEKILNHKMKLASVGELAAGVGHEINNPLAIVHGLVKLIEKKIIKGDYQKINSTSFKKIYAATERIANIVSGLRNLSRIDSELLSKVSLNELLEETIGLLKEIYFNEHNIKINVNFTSDKLLFIKGNKGKLQQVLMNLISNARDATVGQGIRTIDINLNSSQDTVLIEVIDNGKGIPKKLLDKIFDPFFTTKESQKGTGIGLSISFSIINDLGGRLQVKSSGEQGTCFSIELPGYDQIQDVCEAPPEEEFNPKFKKLNFKTLLVDDEEDIREVMRDMLESFGMSVDEAKNGQVAYDLAVKNNYDLIVSDIQMPEFNGFEFLKKLRSTSEITQPEFIFITGGVKSQMDASLKSKIQGILYKPIDEDEAYEAFYNLLTAA